MLMWDCCKFGGKFYCEFMYYGIFLMLFEKEVDIEMLYLIRFFFVFLWFV